MGGKGWQQRHKERREKRQQEKTQRLSEAIVKAQKPRWPKLLAIWTGIGVIGLFVGLAVDVPQLRANADIINPALDDPRWPFSMRFEFVPGGPYSVHKVRLMCFILEGKLTDSKGHSNRFTLTDMNVLLGGKRTREVEQVEPNKPLTAQCSPAFKNDTTFTLELLDMVVKYRFERHFTFTRIAFVHCDNRRFILRKGLNGELQWYKEASYKIPPDIAAMTGSWECK